MFSIFLVKIIAAIFDFNGSGRLGRELGERWSKIRRGGENEYFYLSPPPPPLLPPSSNQTWPVELTIASFLTLTRPNKTPFLQAIYKKEVSFCYLAQVC